MSIISEIRAEENAKEYEKILLIAIDDFNVNIEDNDFHEETKAVVIFCNNHIYPRYQSTLGDCWRTKESLEELAIEKFFTVDLLEFIE